MMREEDPNIKELFQRLKREDERRAPSFARCWTTARSQLEQRRRRRLMWWLAAAGMASLSLSAGWLIISNREPKRVKPAETAVRRDPPTRPVETLAPPVPSPIHEPSPPANKGVALKQRRNSPAPQPDLASLSEWRSPTEFLLRTPGATLLRTVPRLGASGIVSGSPAPEQKDNLEEQ